MEHRIDGSLIEYRYFPEGDRTEIELLGMNILSVNGHIAMGCSVGIWGVRLKNILELSVLKELMFLSNVENNIRTVHQSYHYLSIQ